jgi:uncharacterized coiled-coil DUF342 family protein
MDEVRYARLESRVDEIKDDVSEIKADQKINNYEMSELKNAIKEQIDVVRSHVTGDEKIISQLEPIIQDFQFRQERQRRRVSALKELGMKLAIPATVVGLIGASIKIWVSF